MTTALILVLVGAMVAGLTLMTASLNTPRPTLARVALAGFTASTVMWAAISLAYAVLGPRDPTATIAWTLPVVALMIAFFRVLIQSVRNAAWTPSRWYVMGVLIHPLVMLAFAAVPHWHGLLVTVTGDGAAEYAPVFWLHSAVSYGLLTGSLIMLVTARRMLPQLATRGLTWTIASWSLPVAANAFTIIDQGAAGPDLTPVAFTVTALFMGRSMILDGLADVIPVARVEVFESLTDAVFVLDTSGRVIDCNMRARRVLEMLGFAGRFHGRMPVDIAPNFVDVLQTDGERDVVLDGEDLVVKVSRSELRDRKQRVLGTLVHVRNITEEALRTRELIRVSEQLEEEARANELLRAELAEQVVRDVDTGLHNRRYVFESLPALVATCEAERRALAVVLFDIDHFKDINDTYGHSAGDRALRMVSTAMRHAAGDAVVARFGGEEFVVIFPSPSIDDAVARAEHIRHACARVQVPAREGSISVTVSAGVAWAAPGGIDASRLIEDADDALYIAKNGGRNRSSVAARDGR